MSPHSPKGSCILDGSSVFNGLREKRPRMLECGTRLRKLHVDTSLPEVACLDTELRRHAPVNYAHPEHGDCLPVRKLDLRI